MDVFVIYNDANNCPGRRQAPCDPPLRLSSGWPIDFLWGNFFCRSSGPHSSGIYNDAQHVIGPADLPGDPTSWTELHFLIFKIQASRIRFGPFALPRAFFRKKPRSTGCVCVWNIWTGVKLLLVFLFAGGTGVTLVPVPTKTASCHSDIKRRRPFDVPAPFRFSEQYYSDRLSWEPAGDTIWLVLTCARLSQSDAYFYTGYLDRYVCTSAHFRILNSGWIPSI